MERTIENPRVEIDAIDIELLRLLNMRAAIALRVGAAKTSVETSLCDPNREKEVLSRLRQENTGPFDEHSVDNIFQRIIDESLLLQQRTYQKPFANSDSLETEVRRLTGKSRVAFPSCGVLRAVRPLAENKRRRFVGEAPTLLGLVTFDFEAHLAGGAC